MYQVRNGTIPKIFNNNFFTVDHFYPTRFASNSFQFPRSTKTPRFSILSRGPKLWNQFLTNNEKVITSQGTFKRLLKKKILDFNNELIFF